jgi:hypothetical protein
MSGVSNPLEDVALSSSGQVPVASPIPELPADVLAFCQRKGLTQDVKTAVELAKQSFRSDKLRLQIEGDPEGEEEWVVIDVDVQGTVNEVLGAYDSFKEKWLTAVATDRGRLVRLLYNII